MRQSRDACDRCHGMKTRCVRVHESQVCVRCERLGMPCNYSPPGRTGRPLGSKRGRATSNTNEASLPPAEAGLPSNPLCHTGSVVNNNFTNMGSSGYLKVGLEDNESYSEHSYSMSRSTVSDSFLDSLITEGIRPVESPLTNPYSSNSASIHFPTSFGPSSVGTSDSGIQDTSPPQRDQQNLTVRLLDVQRHLDKLSRTFADGVTTAEDIRDMYRVSETLMSVIGHVEEQLQRRQHLSQPSDFISNGAVVLLMSSCYLNLIQAYQCLVVVLEQELNGNARTPVTTEEGHGQARGNNPSPGSANGSSPQFPSISVGGLQLEMPRKATAEINLHLVAQTVQHLKASLQRCTRWLSSARSSPPTSSSSSSPYDISWDQQSDRLDGSNPMKSLIDLALGDLNTREENLIGQLRTVMFSAGARTYYT